MTKQRMTFDIDKHTVTEGDIVEVRWRCAEADNVLLTIDNGYRSNEMSLPNEGSKRFRLNRSKGRTKLTIAVTIMDKTYHKQIKVHVKKMPTVRAETIDQHGRRQNQLQISFGKFGEKLRNLRNKWRLALQVLPEKKQLAAKLLIVMGLLLIFCAIWPKIYSFILPLLVVYLAWILFKR